MKQRVLPLVIIVFAGWLLSFTAWAEHWHVHHKHQLNHGQEACAHCSLPSLVALTPSFSVFPNKQHAPTIKSVPSALPMKAAILSGWQRAPPHSFSLQGSTF
ncbi:hypothetical protein [Motilimonas pumila]|uniref:hypothetical protein n=1 Tax=Motilimonas pumila TaxID=2303987 RepID=UPI0011C35ECA|nr:hypothetical protein [Motilimonas pumila]